MCVYAGDVSCAHVCVYVCVCCLHNCVIACMLGVCRVHMCASVWVSEYVCVSCAQACDVCACVFVCVMCTGVWCV